MSKIHQMFEDGEIELEDVVDLIDELPLDSLLEQVILRLSKDCVYADIGEMEISLDPEIYGEKYDVTLTLDITQQ